MAGNSNSGGNGKALKLGTELAQRVRGAVLNTFDTVERKGHVISDILSDAFISNPLKFLDTVSKFCPKDIAMEVTNIAQANAMTDQELADLIADRARKRRELEAIEGQFEVTDKQEETG